MRRSGAKEIAFGGVMAALAMVIMCLGGLIPIATFVCPVLCMLVLKLICRLFGNRIGWAWYGCVALLAMLLGPDKEAAAVFVCLGYYPILKPKFDRLKFAWLFKGLYFNVVIFIMYRALIYLFGMDQLAEEYAQLGKALTIALLVMGNLVFFLLDKVLGRRFKRRKRHG